MKIDYRPLCPALGSEVHGIDLAPGISDALFDEIRELWNRANGVLVIRDQNISVEQQIAFSRKFGKLHTLQGHTVAKYLHPDHPEIYRVSNKVMNGKPQGRKGAGTYWHSDQSYEKTPAMASILYALEIPPYGGDTIYTSMYKAYDALSDTMKTFLAGLDAVHDFAVAQGGGFSNENITQEQLQKAPPITHPVVRTHPETGCKCLFVNPGFTSHIVGVTKDESQAILELLYRHCTKSEFQYRHVWQLNDLVIWDNRCTMHYAVMDYEGLGDRLMHRCTVIGEVPLNSQAAQAA